MAWDTGEVSTPDVVTLDTTGATIQVVEPRWLLDRLGDAAKQVALEVDDAAVNWDTTTETVTAADGVTVIDPGTVTGKQWTLSARIVTVAALDDLRHVLDGDRILLRGPHGEWDWVQPQRSFGADQVAVFESDAEDRGNATQAENPYEADVKLKLNVDTRWTTVQ